MASPGHNELMRNTRDLKSIWKVKCQVIKGLMTASWKVWHVCSVFLIHYLVIYTTGESLSLNTYICQSTYVLFAYKPCNFPIMVWLCLISGWWLLVSMIKDKVMNYGIEESLRYFGIISMCIVKIHQYFLFHHLDNAWVWCFSMRRNSYVSEYSWRTINDIVVRNKIHILLMDLSFWNTSLELIYLIYITLVSCVKLMLKMIAKFKHLYSAHQITWRQCILDATLNWKIEYLSN